MTIRNDVAKDMKAFNRWLITLFLAALLAFNQESVAAQPAEASHLKRSSRNLQQLATTRYFVLVHLSLQYVNDTFAGHFAMPTSDTVRHFCSSVNEQAGGNQVASAAREHGIFEIKTRIGGTVATPDYQCSIVYAGRIPGAELDINRRQSRSELYSFGVTVEQTVYATANRTLSLGSVTSMIESGFNRGRGGRVKFRSLLKEHPMFATVTNVEVLEGPLTRHPTFSPTVNPTSMPTETPSPLPSRSPSVSPTKAPSVPPSLSPTDTPIIPTTEKPATEKPQPLTLPPTEQPTNDLKAPTLQTAFATSDRPGGDAANPLIVAAVATMIAIAALLVLVACYCSRRRKAEKDTKVDVAHQAASSRKREKRPKGDDQTSHVPGMVQLDDDNRSLANTTLGDQTAGGGRGQRLSPKKNAAEKPIGDRVLNSFVDSSTYTTRQNAVPSVELSDSSNRGAVDSIYASSNSNSIMLPPSVMAFEEESMFPVTTVSGDSTYSESEAPPSSLLSESFASSSHVASETNRGPVDVDTLATVKRSNIPLKHLEPHGMYAKSGPDVRAIRDSLDARAKKQEEVAKIITGAPEDGRDSRAVRSIRIDGGKRDPKAPTSPFESKAKPPADSADGFSGQKEQASRFSPFETNEAPKSAKLDFGKASAIDFRSLGEDTTPSVSSGMSNLTNKAENLLRIGLQPPPEDHEAQESMQPHEEEKREIEFETREDGKDEGGSGRPSLPFDLLADTQLLDRSPSPASWSSWKVQQDKPPKPGDVGPGTLKEETKSTLTDDLNEGSAYKAPYRTQFLGGGSAALATVGLRHFLPPREERNEAKESSDSLERPSEEKKDDSPPPEGRETLTPPPSAGSSPLEDGNGTLGVKPRKEADALALDARSGSSSSTGLSNPWLFDAVEQTLGPRSVTADIESLSGRSNRSGKSHRSTRSRHSHRSHKSNRSYNVPPSGKYKGRGDGRIHSAAASVASYSGSSFERKSAYTAKNVTHDLNRLELQLAALRSETDQITASSITLSSVGTKTKSTRSSKLTHTGAKIIRKRRVIVEVPPGKLGIVLANSGKGTFVSEVRPGSSLKGMLSPGDKLVAIDGQDVHDLSVNQITTIMSEKQDMERLLTVITSTHQETRSIDEV